MVGLHLCVSRCALFLLFRCAFCGLWLAMFLLKKAFATLNGIIGFGRGDSLFHFGVTGQPLVHSVVHWA